MDIVEILKELSDTNGPTGFEGPVGKRAAKLLEDLTDQVWTDKLGNVLAVKRCGKKDPKKVLLDAHLDEVGMVVTGYEEGFLRFAGIKNAIDPRVLPAGDVVILTESPIRGIVTCLPPHVQTAEQMAEAVPVDKLFIDAGLDESCTKAQVPIGTPVVYAKSFCRLSDSVAGGKAMDDRACFTAILRALELLKDVRLDFDLYVMGSVQEEAGSRGAAVGAFSVDPDYAVVLDVTHAATPDAEKDKTFAFGGGPAIGVGPSMSRKLSDMMKVVAKESNIDCQIEVMAGRTGTNGWATQISREGVPTAILSIPVKYMHSPCETVHLDDLEDTALLLSEFLKNAGRWL